MTSQQLFVEIVQAALQQHKPEDEIVLACMVVLHTHDFVVTEDCVLSDVVWSERDRKVLRAITQRHAADVVATAMGRGLDQKYIDYWYTLYVTKSPYEVIDSLPHPFRSIVDKCRLRMSGHRFIATIVEAE